MRDLGRSGQAVRQVEHQPRAGFCALPDPLAGRKAHAPVATLSSAIQAAQRGPHPFSVTKRSVRLMQGDHQVSCCLSRSS